MAPGGPVAAVADLLGFVQDNDFPAVVKPRLSTGSRSVWVLHDEAEVHGWLETVWSLGPEICPPVVARFVEGQTCSMTTVS